MKISTSSDNNTPQTQTNKQSGGIEEWYSKVCGRYAEGRISERIMRKYSLRYEIYKSKLRNGGKL